MNACLVLCLSPVYNVITSDQERTYIRCRKPSRELYGPALSELYDDAIQSENSLSVLNVESSRPRHHVARHVLRMNSNSLSRLEGRLVEFDSGTLVDNKALSEE